MYQIFNKLFNFKQMKLFLKISVLIFLAFGVQSCWMYSFTGASIPPQAKTVSVAYFPNRATQVQPTLSQDLTEALKDRLQSQTSLNIVEQKGDLQFEGIITGYRIAPSAVTGNEQSAQNRLTITVKVKYIDTFDKKNNFEQSFTEYADFESNLSFESIEQELDKEIIDKLVEEIFNKALVNW